MHNYNDFYSDIDGSWQLEVDGVWVGTQHLGGEGINVSNIGWGWTFPGAETWENFYNNVLEATELSSVTQVNYNTFYTIC